MLRVNPHFFRRFEIVVSQLEQSRGRSDLLNFIFRESSGSEGDHSSVIGV